ncbi:hypothetical protein FXW78_50010 [Rhodococcus opacus]|nr:hypothetical protein [Rhodococcus opacus]
MPDFSEFPELSEDQLAVLPIETRQAYDELRAMAPEERVRFMGHVKLVNTVQRFLGSVCESRDLRSVWSMVDPDFRMVLAQQWLLDNDGMWKRVDSTEMTLRRL